ncbi:MAG: hypothetical protein ACREBU_22600, partial [Nitrososphaera sp.]
CISPQSGSLYLREQSMKMLPIYVLMCIATYGCSTLETISQVTLDEQGYPVTRTVTNYCDVNILAPSVCVATLTDRHNAAAPGGGREKLIGVVNASTSGFGPSIIGGSAAVGSAHLIGRGLKESGSGNDNSVNVETSAGSFSGSETTVTTP